MEIFNAMDLIGSVDRERDAVQALPAHNASEALRMIRFSRRPENSLQNRLQAHRTLLQCVQVVDLAERMTFERVEWLSLKIDLALLAGEALDVINVFHGSAAGGFAHGASAFNASPVAVRVGVGLLHFLYY